MLPYNDYIDRIDRAVHPMTSFVQDMSINHGFPAWANKLSMLSSRSKRYCQMLWMKYFSTQE